MINFRIKYCFGFPFFCWFFKKIMLRSFVGEDNDHRNRYHQNSLIGFYWNRYGIGTGKVRERYGFSTVRQCLVWEPDGTTILNNFRIKNCLGFPFFCLACQENRGTIIRKLPVNVKSRQWDFVGFTLELPWNCLGITTDVNRWILLVGD